MSRPLGLPEPWKKIATQLGGVASVAELCRVSTMTIWRWAHGESEPSEHTIRFVNDALRDVGLPAPFREKK